MQERDKRLKIIKEIIGDHKIRNQEELLGILKSKNVSVTQATLSRDLKSLRVGKVSDGNRGYYYSLPDQRTDRERDEHFIQDIHRGTISLTSSGNLIVIHTMPGHANTVAFALDRLEIEEIAGTIAGDDTILLILAEGIIPSEFHEKMSAIISHWEDYL